MSLRETVARLRQSRVARDEPGDSVERGRIDISHLGSGHPTMPILTGTTDEPTWSIVDRSGSACMSTPEKQP